MWKKCENFGGAGGDATPPLKIPSLPLRLSPDSSWRHGYFPGIIVACLNIPQLIITISLGYNAENQLRYAQNDTQKLNF
jgi:hypothetical protein